MVFKNIDIHPLRITNEKRKKIVNLLLISDGEKKHFCLIKDLNRLLSSQVSKHKEAKQFCLRCLNHFPNKKKLALHEEYCSNNEAIKIEMPEEGSVIKFKNFNRSMRVPFVVYADFEALTEKIETCQPNNKKSFTKPYQKQTLWI